jgi:hypothetical protein
MPRKRPTPEEIVAKLRQVDVLISQGKSVADAVWQSTLHRHLWHAIFGRSQKITLKVSNGTKREMFLRVLNYN